MSATSFSREFAMENINGIELRYPEWHAIVGRILVRLRDQFFGSSRADFDIWLDCAPLLDWISLQYALRSYDDKPVLPTEMLNADASRAFGRLCRKGFTGSCYVVASEDSALVEQMVTATSQSRSWLHVQIFREPEGAWAICARAFDSSLSLS